VWFRGHAPRLGTCHEIRGPELIVITALRECKIKKEDAVMLGKNKQINFKTLL